MLSRTLNLARMTETALRKALNAKRLEEGWGFDALYADVVRVVGAHLAPSAATLRRFISNERKTHEKHLHFIRKYVDSLGGKTEAVA